MRNACARTCMRTESALPDITCKRVRNHAQQSECPRKHTQIGLIFVYGKTGAGGGQIRCCRRVFLITSAACQSWPKDDWPRWQISAAASAPLSRPAIGVGVEVVCRRCTHTSTQTGMLMRTQMSTQTPGRLSRNSRDSLQSLRSCACACVRVCGARRRKQIPCEHGAHRYGSGAGGPG